MRPMLRSSKSGPSRFRPSAPTGRRATATAALIGAAALTVAGCGQGEPQNVEQPRQTEVAAADPVATATIHDAEGDELGTVEFAETDGGLQVSAALSGLESGYYGFHVHEIGECEPDSAAPDDPSETGAFLSGGSHIGADDSEHPGHPGDLPPLLVTEDGTAELTVVTDRLTAEMLLDDDTSAIMVHSQPDNFANIPERYAPDGPDSDTTGTGDAGDRLACGVVE